MLPSLFFFFPAFLFHFLGPLWLPWAHVIIQDHLPILNVMTNLDSILQGRDMTLPTKVHLVKALVFPVVTYGCGSWTIQKAEHQRIDAFELWCWRRLLRVPWSARRPNQSILKEISQSWIFIGRTDAEGEAPILWPPDAKNWLWKIPWCWERLKAGAEGDNRGWDGWMASLTWWTGVWASSGSWWWTGRPGVLQSMGSQRVRHDWATELNWTNRQKCLNYWWEFSQIKKENIYLLS